MKELKPLNLKLKVYNDAGKMVSKRIDPMKLGKLGLSLSELKSIHNVAKEYAGREPIITKLLQKVEKHPEINREHIKASLAYKESIIYFEQLEKSSMKLIGVLEAIPVLKSRIVYKGKGSNLRTLSERLELIA